MSNKDSRSGGKYTGTHTTLIPVAIIVCDIAERCPDVTRISPGFIKAGLPSVQGKHRLKITKESGGLRLSIRDNTTHQIVHVYAENVEVAIKAIVHEAKKAGLVVKVE